MANKSRKVEIDSEKLLKAINERGYSIRQLAKEPEIDRAEKTIRFALKDKEMQVELLFRICWVLGMDMEQFMIKKASEEVKVNERDTLKIRYSSYLRQLLSMFGVTTKQLYELTDEQRFQLQRDLFDNISPVIRKHFPSESIESPTEWAMYEMDMFLDEYHGVFEPLKIDAINDEMDRGYEEWMRNNPPDEDDDPFAAKYGKPITEFDE